MSDEERSAARVRPSELVHETTADGGTDLLLEVSNLAKAFGPTKALRDCSFTLRPGEVHVLVGENGSGKSTLVKILSGVHAPDTGSIRIRGAEAQPRTPRASQDLGVVTVFQEVLVAEACSVLDNVWLGIDETWRTRVPAREKRRRARKALDELLERPIDLNLAVEDLSLSERQACGIVRALLRDPKILILDEATSALDVATRDRLFSTVRRLADQGVGVIVITHRMDEIAQIGDRITVMRSGDTVATLARGAWDMHELVRLMTGSETLSGAERAERAEVSTRVGAPVLSGRGLRLRPNGSPIDVQVRSGEMIGVAGLEGHGGSEFLEALWGVPTGSGEVIRHTEGGDVVIGSPREAADYGVAYVPRERGSDSLFRWMSIRENFALPTLSRDTRFGWLNLRSSARRLNSYVRRIGIVLGAQDDPITTLSGGNQQKVVIARWLASGPRVLLLNDPTRGIDIGAKRDLYALLGELANHGLAVVMLSTELDEHIELMDRVLVFREGDLFREIPRREVSRESLVAAFFGEGEEESRDRTDIASR